MTERTLGREQAIYRVTWIGFAVNLVLSAGKLAAGIWGHSAAMVADAIHSVSDFAIDLVVLLFVRVSAKPRDDDHDYGHGKYETLATLIIGARLQVWESSCCGAEAQRSATSREASFRHSRASWRCGRPSYRSSPKKRSIATRRASAEGSTAPRSWPTHGITAATRSHR